MGTAPTLFARTSERDTPVKIFVLSPHRDDAAFSLGLAIEAWLAAGHKVQVLNLFTQSQYAPFSDVASLHANDRTSFVTAVRRKEDVAWNKLLKNGLQFHDLDLLDAPLRLNCGLDELATVEIRAGDRAVARVAGAIGKVTRGGAPETTAVVAPLAVGGHIDHRVTRQAAVEVLGALALPVGFYEDLPYSARAEEQDRLGSYAEGVPLGLRPVFTTMASADAAAAIRRKTKMSECYDSQVDSETVRSIAEFSERYDGRERLWGNAAWLGSALAVPEESGT
jgi:LmbE family N-acetylglucosaminyl deacetylase